MKKTETAIIASILTLIFGFAPVSAFASGDHDGGHGKAMEFDPVANEFGNYKPKMHVTRTIKIVMSDKMRFSPDMIKVKKGDVIKFVHTNPGELMHEFVLGTPELLIKHAEMMRKFPGMEHSEPYMTHVAPGKTGEIVWEFSKSGEFAFGCLIPGHFDAGMKGSVIVGS